jgi:hypothetical protein
MQKYNNCLRDGRTLSRPGFVDIRRTGAVSKTRMLINEEQLLPARTPFRMPVRGVDATAKDALRA